MDRLRVTRFVWTLYCSFDRLYDRTGEHAQNKNFELN